MKWFGLAILVLIFPASLWLSTIKSKFTLNLNSSREGMSSRIDSSNPETLDLDVAADQTIKKIAEIDARILATKGELLRYESDRQNMVQELLKIQTKISEVLGNNHTSIK